MKIAIISEEFLPQRTGVAINLMKRLRYFCEKGYQVRVYSPDYSVLAGQYPDWNDYQGEILPGIVVVPFSSQAASLGQLSKSTMVDPKPFSGLAVEKDIIAFEPDIIHVDSPERLFFGFLTVPGKKAAKELGIPLVSFYRTHFVQMLPKYRDYIPWARIPGVITFLHWLSMWVYRQYPIVLTASADTENQLNDWGITHTCTGKFLGVEVEKFMPISRHQDSGPHKCLTVISVTRLDPDKNIDWLLDICSAINNSPVNCRFIFVGDGVEAHKVERWVAGHKNAEYVGSVPNHETVKYYQQADVFITAATHETFGTTLIEAAACGLALMGFREGAVRDRIDDGGNGFLLDAGDISGFADKLLLLDQDRSLLDKFSRRSIQIAGSYSNESTSKNLLDVWEAQIGKSA